jgi:hypothetical protein
MSNPPRAAMVFSPNWPTFLFTALKARDQTIKILTADPNQLPGEPLVVVTMAAFAVEAFINELGVAAGMAKFGREQFPSPILDQLEDLSNALAETENYTGSVALKYQIARTILAGSTFPRGQQPFQGLHELFQLRDILAHPRHRDTIDDEGRLVPDAKLLRNFRQLGLSRLLPQKPGDDVGMLWLMQFQSAEMAAWGYTRACAIIKAVGDLIPADPGIPSIWMFKDRTQTLPA